MKRPTVSIDPGLDCCGVALWATDGRLLNARLVKSPLDGDLAMRWIVMSRLALPVQLVDNDLAIELPQVYRASRTKGGKGTDPNALIALAGLVGAIAARMKTGTVTTYLPAAWKGQVPKDVMCKRIEGKLSESERARVELPTARGLQHNVWDAIGIGAHHLRVLRHGL